VLYDNCKNLIKTRKIALESTQQKQHTIKNTLKELNITPYNYECFDNDDVNYDLEIQNIKNKIQKTQKKYLEIEIELETKEKIKKQLKTLYVDEISTSELEIKIKNINLHLQQWEKFQTYQLKCNQTLPIVENIEKEIKDCETIISFDQQWKKQRDIVSSLKTLKQEIINSSIEMKCPECHAIVSLCGDILKPFSSSSNKYQITIEKAKQNNQQLSMLQNKLDELQNKKLAIDDLKHQYKSEQNFTERLALLQKIQQHNKYLNILDTLRVEKPSYPETPEVLQRKLKNKYTYQQLTLQLNSILSTPQSWEEQKNLLEKYNHQLNDLKNKKKQIVSTKYWHTLNDLKEAEDKLHLDYPRSIKLQELIKKAEKLTLEIELQEINTRVQQYLDCFLENISVTLQALEGKINTNVIYNGVNTDLNNLSGGEMARVSLAFTISLAEINNVDLLLLDECVASLDQETTTRVINTIQENFTGQVICIAHQTTQGIFDHVLEI
jgi:DNA repair exonuclease SbcCD ATPase subunit